MTFRRKIAKKRHAAGPAASAAAAEGQREERGREAERAERVRRVQRVRAGVLLKIGKCFAICFQIFGGLVLGCIKTKFCKKICV